MRGFFITLAFALMAVGAVWLLEGLDMISGHFLFNLGNNWPYYGAGAVLAGVLLLMAADRHRR
jgi:uncharacterized membrane protein HdeD (DUF308 family)